MSEREPWLGWAVLFVVYVAAGYVFHTAALNWIIGPLLPVMVLVLVPKALGRRR